MAKGTTSAQPGRRADVALRAQLLALLGGGHAHAGFEAAIKGIPPALRNRAPNGLPYSPWHLLEHMRIALWDILEFSRSADHVSPSWPEGYWPSEKCTESAWRKSVHAFRDDLQGMKGLVSDPASDLMARIPWGDGQTLLREALLVADHNAYHIGELIVVRRLLGIWRA
jgi:hypothetical protein